MEIRRMLAAKVAAAAPTAATNIGHVKMARSATTLGDAEFVPRRAIRSMNDQVALEAGQVAYLRNQTMRSIRQCLSKIGIIP
jgi:hypothetical protein